MKKLLLFPLFILAISILAPSCTKDDNEIFPPGNDSIANNDTLGTNDTISGDTISGDTVQNVPLILKYEGDLIVNGTYLKENAVCGINIKRSQITLYLYKAKFAENMPVELDITVPGIPFNRQTFVFEGDTIVPLGMGSAPMPTYTFTRIDGVAGDSTLSFDAELTRGTISFNGTFIGR